MADEKKPSKVEGYKERSDFLRGPIAGDMADSNPYVSDESYELLKFHGSYQGYNRDTATERKKAGLEKEWEFMLRMTCPAGRLTADQYLAIEQIAANYANDTMRVTTRQTFQFHCIVKGNLKAHIAELNEIAIRTLGGCGDVVRNVMCSAAPIKDEVHRKLVEDTHAIAKFCTPKSTAYHQIWLDGNDLADQPKEVDEPLYGLTYMPRKFKIGLATPDDNAIDVLTHDLAIIPIYEGQELQGYNIAIGGGLGMTHNKPNTYPRLATPVAFIENDELLPMTEAVIKLQRDHGDRTNRKHARLKYVVEENGIEWTLATLAKYFGKTLTPPKAIAEYKVVDHMGWHEQGDGKLYLGVPVDSGRIQDNEHTKVKSALHEVITKFSPEVILTGDQNVILAEIDPANKEAITDILRGYKVKLREDITDVHRFTLACVALPTCGKALAEAERVKLPMVGLLEDVMEKYGVREDRITIRIAGCPNGCSRPYVGDIGIVGRTPGTYALFIGGDFEGTRLNSKILDKVPYEHLKDVFDVLFESYVQDRSNDNEGFGDFAHRVGEASLMNKVVERFGGKHKWAKAV